MSEVKIKNKKEKRERLAAIVDRLKQVYPERFITSIRSSSGLGIVSKVFAVVINMTLLRSNGISR